ncbi:hypothetical protein B9Z31_08600 [Limnohabitans sp. G3-2]|nr:hypothetical protein B9Z31_08600 [Limnohabitans sp. G3-2]
MRGSDLRTTLKGQLLFRLEAAQVWSLLARATQLVSGFVTLGLVAHFFDLSTQGYFFTFNSLIALQVFAEMGLSMVLIQFSAHEMAKLNWTEAGKVEGDKTAKARLRALLIFALGWFGVSGILLVVILIPAGEWFFNRAVTVNILPANLLLHWNLLVFFVSGNLIVTAICNIIEGTGRVTEVAGVRFAQFIGGGFAAWIAIAQGVGLLALALQYGVMLVIGITYLLTYRRRFIWDLIRAKLPSHALAWRREILPFQWRIAVSWLSGYFVFQYTTPLLFSTHGPEAAGRMGMTMQVFSAISSICIIFVTARIPIFGRMVANRIQSELDILFRRSVVQSFAALVAALMLAMILLTIVHWHEFSISTRLLPLGQSWILALACIGSHSIYVQSVYLRTHKQEPFMKLSVINGVLMAGLSTWFIPQAGTAGAVAVYTFVTLCISAPIGTWIYLKFRSKIVAVDSKI